MLCKTLKTLICFLLQHLCFVSVASAVCIYLQCGRCWKNVINFFKKTANCFVIHGAKSQHCMLLQTKFMVTNVSTSGFHLVTVQINFLVLPTSTWYLLWPTIVWNFDNLFHGYYVNNAENLNSEVVQTSLVFSEMFIWLRHLLFISFTYLLFDFV